MPKAMRGQGVLCKPLKSKVARLKTSYTRATKSNPKKFFGQEILTGFI